MTTTTISSGVTSSGINVSGGEYLVIQHGGIAQGTVVSSGGHLLDFGHDVGTVIGSGGHETVESAGIAYSAVVSSGGSLLVEGRIRGGLTIDGGFAEIAIKNETALEIITLANSGIVQIDKVTESRPISLKVAGMDQRGNEIEVVGASSKQMRIAFHPEGGGSGTLDLTWSGGSYHVELIGHFIGRDFEVDFDNHGNAFIIDHYPTANFTQAAAGMTQTPGASVHEGGSATPVATSPLAAAASSGR